MTQLEIAKSGKISPEMRAVAEIENLDPEYIRAGVAAGTIVIPKNVHHDLGKICGIGAGLRTKVNANIGTSGDFPNVEDELVKLRIAIESGADALMDLSTGGDLAAVRKTIVENCSVPLGTVPIYEAVVRAGDDGIIGLKEDDLFGVIERNAKDGVDFVTVHCGITRESVARLKKQGRIADVVSRGGAFLVSWMLANDTENPLFTRFDELLEICREHDVTLSLGDGMRPGCLADATDRPQVQELIILGELVDRARAAGVQAMVEGPGHVPMNQVAANMQIQKTLCKGAPFYVLGPLVTDVAPGYDHITSAIGGAIAAASGVDFLCYVTPAEHLGLPGPDDVREGVVASRIAAHAGDIAKGIKGAMDWDREMSIARKALDWNKQLELCMDPIKFKQYREERATGCDEVCSMCGKYCAMKVVNEYLRK